MNDEQNQLFQQAMSKITAELVTGNTVILKPSSGLAESIKLAAQIVDKELSRRKNVAATAGRPRKPDSELTRQARWNRRSREKLRPTATTRSTAKDQGLETESQSNFLISSGPPKRPREAEALTLTIPSLESFPRKDVPTKEKRRLIRLQTLAKELGRSRQGVYGYIKRHEDKIKIELVDGQIYVDQEEARKVNLRAPNKAKKART